MTFFYWTMVNWGKSVGGLWSIVKVNVEGSNRLMMVKVDVEAAGRW